MFLPIQARVLLSLVFVLSACGKKGETVLAPHERVVLYNSQGIQGPEKLAELGGKFPFGVVVTSHNKNGLQVPPGLCSATHIAPQWVLTASHCIAAPFHGFKTGDVLHSVSVVFYDKQGKAQSASVQDAYLSGVAYESDVALLRLQQPIGNWDVWEEKAHRFFSSTQSPREKGFQATLWVFDPVFSVRRSRNKADASIAQMHFVVKECRGSLQPPVLRSQKGDELLVSKVIPSVLEDREMDEKDPLYLRQFNTSNFAFFDDCQRDLIKGNSGGLITTRQGTEIKPVAVFSAYTVMDANSMMRRLDMSLDEFEKSKFELLGPSKQYGFTGKTFPSGQLFAMGSRLDLESSPVLRLIEYLTALRFDTP